MTVVCPIYFTRRLRADLKGHVAFVDKTTDPLIKCWVLDMKRRLDVPISIDGNPVGGSLLQLYCTVVEPKGFVINGWLHIAIDGKLYDDQYAGKLLGIGDARIAHKVLDTRPFYIRDRYLDMLNTSPKR